MSLSELARSSRSCRSFTGERLSRETLAELCALTRYCPAAMNLQPLKYRLVTSEEECARLLSMTRWASSLSVKLPPEGHGPGGFILICHDNRVTPYAPIFSIDVGIAAQTVMLGAAERGLGGCIIGSGDPARLSEALGLPSHLTPMLLLGLGVPDEQVVLVDAEAGAVKYYRDENNVHYVPKRPLEELIIV